MGYENPIKFSTHLKEILWRLWSGWYFIQFYHSHKFSTDFTTESWNLGVRCHHFPPGKWWFIEWKKGCPLLPPPPPPAVSVPPPPPLSPRSPLLFAPSPSRFPSLGGVPYRTPPEAGEKGNPDLWIYRWFPGMEEVRPVGGADHGNASFRCVHCGHPVGKLLVQYSPGNIRLMKCVSECFSFLRMIRCRATKPWIACNYSLLRFQFCPGEVQGCCRWIYWVWSHGMLVWCSFVFSITCMLCLRLMIRATII